MENVYIIYYNHLRKTPPKSLYQAFLRMSFYGKVNIFIYSNICPRMPDIDLKNDIHRVIEPLAMYISSKHLEDNIKCVEILYYNNKYSIRISFNSDDLGPAIPSRVLTDRTISNLMIEIESFLKNNDIKSLNYFYYDNQENFLVQNYKFGINN